MIFSINGGFPKVGVPFWIIRSIVYWDLHWGPLIMGSYHMGGPRNTSIHIMGSLKRAQLISRKLPRLGCRIEDSIVKGLGCKRRPYPCRCLIFFGVLIFRESNCIKGPKMVAPQIVFFFFFFFFFCVFGVQMRGGCAMMKRGWGGW